MEGDFIIAESEYKINAKCPKCGKWIHIRGRVYKNTEKREKHFFSLFTSRYKCYCGNKAFLKTKI